MNSKKTKTCLVTAAGQGIGRAIVDGLLSAGHKVIATDRDVALLEGLIGVEKCEVHELDVTEPAAIAALSHYTNTVDVLCHCAGYVDSGTVLDITDAQYDFNFQLNVQSAVRLAQAVLPGMVSRNDGALIFISSVASAIKGVPNRSIYGTTKAALLGLSKSIAADFVAEGIRSNCICPGTVETPSLSERIAESGSDIMAQRKEFIARQPMGRLGRAEEIAALAVFLSDPMAGFMTGQALAIDGGWTI
ncbi:SDR family oxidoreductase [Pacificibacter marinus]|uniref:SDR family oxidoreductase n=1 Tax=Pacificibacter marinus TaxID=658057 RepID=UPI001C073F15|nr:SDR family oxidoreductase [Pacificibacter marinus]MBU2868419.1 SDR family oxidoreductase [Pacificibacter marinus]